jgi:hypothetical protein
MKSDSAMEIAIALSFMATLSIMLVGIIGGLS